MENLTKPAKPNVHIIRNEGDNWTLYYRGRRFTGSWDQVHVWLQQEITADKRDGRLRCGKTAEELEILDRARRLF